ncbi:ankyrin repeat domain-containing protein [Dysgonomonas macrotermitis]|uniref:Ankyrin repeat-containing protein n=1 Tax=Dysgonomonas macrotermitis TaxID=1346286 RepID=A0A1M5FMI9_9BACT|nr:ankyrin repeat domain-containing protein [Dysgonomonas macrotermitis]SHF92713.1 Ankyrin repeat-containing protein [Dysgonomonas macrotermitis]
MNRSYLYIFLLFFIVPVCGYAQKEASTAAEMALLEAVKSNRLQDIRSALDAKVSPDITDDYGVNLLMYAVRNENKPIVKLLLERKAKVNYRVNTKADYGTDKSAVRMLMLSGLSVLDFAVDTRDTDMVDMILDAGAKINPSEGILNPLRNASQNNDYAMLMYLSEKGAKVSKAIARDILVMSILRNTQISAVRGNSLNVHIVNFWDNYGVEISEENLLKSTFAKNISSYQKSAIPNMVNSYNKWLTDKQDQVVEERSDEPTVTRRSLNSQSNRIPMSTGYEDSRSESEIDSLFSEAHKRAQENLFEKDLLSEKESTYRRGILAGLGICVFALMLFVYKRYGSLEWAVWVSFYRKLSGQAPPPSRNRNNQNQQNQNNTQNNRQNQNQNRRNQQTKPKPANVQPAKPSPVQEEKHKPKPTITTISANNKRGWTVDDTIGLKVEYLTIEDMINPIRLQNEHEKAIRRMMWYMRRLEQYTDEAVAGTLGEAGLFPHLELLWASVDVYMIREVYKRSLYLMAENYATKDSRVLSFLETMNKPVPKPRRGNKPMRKSEKKNRKNNQ